MNVAILIWWFLGTPMKWYLRRFREAKEKDLLAWSESRRERLKSVFFISADTQAMTGIALSTAGLIQIWNLPIYHLAVILDLLSISANGQAVMLLYGLRQKQKLRKPGRRQWHSLVDPRLPVSLAYISIYYAFSALTYERFNDPLPGRDCLLNIPPQLGNYGKWSLAEATLMLVIFMIAYAQDLIRKPVHQLSKRSQTLIKWMYDAFLPIFTLVYFIWNLADLVGLKVANRSILNDDSENSIQAFGQVVPIVLLILVLLSLWDLWAEDAKDPTENAPGPGQVEMQSAAVQVNLPEDPTADGPKATEAQPDTGGPPVNGS